MNEGSFSAVWPSLIYFLGRFLFFFNERDEGYTLVFYNREAPGKYQKGKP